MKRLLVLLALVVVVVSLAVVGLGATLIAPTWAAYIYFAVGMVVAVIGKKWLREASKEVKRDEKHRI